MVILIILLSIVTGCFDSSNNELWGDAPDFTLTTINDETFTLSDHFGKVIIIDLMAAWCYPCILQMAELKDVIEEKGNEILVVSVDIDKSETSDDVKNTFGDFIDKWTFVLDNYEEDVGTKYQVVGIPKIVIVDKEGNIYYSREGLTSKEILIEEINKASR